MGSSFTVFFEGPFWVGILEEEDSRGYRVTRTVFGAEPGNAELLEFMLNTFHLLLVGLVSEPARPEGPFRPEGPHNPKRIQREARRDQGRGTSTKAQARLSASLAEDKAESKAWRREALCEAEALRFRLRTEKRKARHRGH